MWLKTEVRQDIFKTLLYVRVTEDELHSRMNKNVTKNKILCLSVSSFLKKEWMQEALATYFDNYICFENCNFFLNSNTTTMNSRKEVIQIKTIMVNILTNFHIFISFILLVSIVEVLSGDEFNTTKDADLEIRNFVRKFESVPIQKVRR